MKNNNQLIATKNTKTLIHYLKILEQKKATSLLCWSKTGYGKSFTVIHHLSENKIKYRYMTGYITPLALYQYLYDNKDSLIVLDDLDGLFKNPKIIALLKAILYGIGGKRLVNYETTASMDEYPSSFEFTGSVVILTNELPSKLTETFRSLLSRTISYELIYSQKDILSVVKKIMDNRNLKSQEYKAVDGIIKRNVNPSMQFNFRLLDRLINFVEYNVMKAEELFLSSLTLDKDLQLIWKLKIRKLSKKVQIRLFCEQTGKCRMTYYRLVKKLAV